jgi:hypothetical protein
VVFDVANDTYVDLEAHYAAASSQTNRPRGRARRRSRRRGRTPPETAPGNPAKGNPVKGNPVKGNPVKGNPVKGNPVKGNPVKGNPVKGNAVKGNDQVVDSHQTCGQPSRQFDSSCHSRTMTRSHRMLYRSPRSISATGPTLSARFDAPANERWDELARNWMPTYGAASLVSDNVHAMAKNLWGHARADWAWCLALEVESRFPAGAVARAANGRPGSFARPRTRRGCAAILGSGGHTRRHRADDRGSSRRGAGDVGHPHCGRIGHARAPAAVVGRPGLTVAARYRPGRTTTGQAVAAARSSLPARRIPG